MARAGARDARAAARRAAGHAQTSPRYNLVVPRSRLPELRRADHGGCRTSRSLSYLLLRGRCASCSAPISLRYPLVELADRRRCPPLVAWQFGFGWHAAAALRAHLGR